MRCTYNENSRIGLIIKQHDLIDGDRFIYLQEDTNYTYWRQGNAVFWQHNVSFRIEYMTDWFLKAKYLNNLVRIIP